MMDEKVMLDAEVRNSDKPEAEKKYHGLKDFFKAGKTMPYAFRVKQLKSLYEAIKNKEEAIIHALNKDLKKSPQEAYITEIGPLLSEIKHAISHLSSWMRKKKVGTPLLLWPSKSYLLPEPKGVVMIFSPWNYPFNLTISPLVSALSAGNTAMLKPAHETPNVARVIEQIVSECFDSNYVSVVQGPGAEMGNLLLDHFKFDHILFTGSANTGKIIMAKAAKFLTPVTLELGGKSPVIIDKTADIPYAARRVVWAKYLNSGQTCIAPDYILVHEEVYEDFKKAVLDRIKEVYGENPENSPNLSRIVNADRFDSLAALLKKSAISHGGNTDREDLYIQPTVAEVEDEKVDALMQKEIFGPIMPIKAYAELNDILQTIEQHSHPLSMYIFTNDAKLEKELLSRVSAGGVCINDCILHIGNPFLPFGGVGSSGMGRYHGKYGFETFSHMKPILKSYAWADLSVKYPPYDDWKMKIIRRLLG
jgi:aldehyde dehydrogenase (NAD+)